MNICFTVLGNQEGEKKNPVPYTRMTQKGKFKPRAQKYLKYQQYVVGAFLDHMQHCRCFSRIEKQAMLLRCAQTKFPLTADRKTEVNCMIYFKDRNHGDPENVRKGIIDALFKDDKKVIGYCNYDYDEQPRVEIEISHATQEGAVHARSTIQATPGFPDVA
jgi:hypothetical protein